MRRLVLLAGFCVVGCEKAETPEVPAPVPETAPVPVAPAPTAKASAGKVDAVEGEPVILRGDEKLPATAGAEVQVGDRLKTPAKAKLRVVMSDATIIAIGAASEVTLSKFDVDEAKGRAASLKVAAGKFWMQVAKWAGQGESLWEAETPNAVAGVRGTTLWGDTKVDAICALEGTIEVRSLKNAKQKPATLTAGNCAAKLSKGKLAPLKPKPKQVQGYLKEVLIE